MEKAKNEKKIRIAFNKRLVTVDLRSIIAISHPKEGDDFFRVYFSGSPTWNVCVDQFERLYSAWNVI